MQIKWNMTSRASRCRCLCVYCGVEWHRHDMSAGYKPIHACACLYMSILVCTCLVELGPSVVLLLLRFITYFNNWIWSLVRSNNFTSRFSLSLTTNIKKYLFDFSHSYNGTTKLWTISLPDWYFCNSSMCWNTSVVIDSCFDVLNSVRFANIFNNSYFKST